MVINTIHNGYPNQCSAALYSSLYIIRSLMYNTEYQGLVKLHEFGTIRSSLHN